MKKVYLVLKGNRQGIFRTAEEYKKSIEGFSGIMGKGFNTVESALSWWKTHDTKGILKENDIRKAFGEKIVTKEERIPLTIYTDASICGIYGGWGGIVLCGEKEKLRLNGRKIISDSGYMELYAIYKILKHLKKNNWNLNHAVVYCDYKYISDKWNTNCCPTDKYPKLWKKIWKILVKYDMEIKWIKAHAGDKHNSQCDKLAKDAITNT